MVSPLFNIYRFLDTSDSDGNEQLNMEHAFLMMGQIQLCWLGLKVAAEELLLLRKAVTTGNVTLEHRWLEIFDGEAT